MTTEESSESRAQLKDVSHTPPTGESVAAIWKRGDEDES
jgi:hypothetical protein